METLWPHLLPFFIIIATILHHVLNFSSPCGTEWEYQVETGKCYKYYSDNVAWSAARSQCEGFATNDGAWTGRTHLATIPNQREGVVIMDMLALMANYKEQWIGAKKNGGVYQWITTNSSLSIPDEWKGDTYGTDDCLAYKFENVFIGNDWKKKFYLVSRPCEDVGSYLCEYQAASCERYNLASHGVSGFNDATSMLNPNQTNVGLKIKVDCIPGFYYESERPGATTVAPPPNTDGLLPNTIECDGSLQIVNNPESFSAAWNVPAAPYGEIEVCKPVKCSIFNGSLKNVDGMPDFSGKSVQFDYGKEFFLNCSMGYVNYKNASKIVSSMTCGQKSSDKGIGEWKPADLQTCVAVRCNLSEMYQLVPKDAKLVSAENRMTRAQLTEFQKSSFNKYDNIVKVSCKEGLFFKDRSFEKFILCALEPNNRLVGKWEGYQGTDVPISTKCIDVVCKYQEVATTLSMNIKENFLMVKYGETKNLTEHDGEDYSFDTHLIFTCRDGYESANKLATQDVKCGIQGLWTPQLTSCIKITKKLETGASKHYLPPPAEAPQAQSVGTMVVVLLVIFITVIIIMDIATLSRDLRVLKANLRNLRRYFNSKKES